MGDEYTPKTEDVRSAWWRDKCPPNDLDFDDIYNAAFDRWLNEFTATVLESARNRLNGHDPAGEQLQRMADEKRNPTTHVSEEADHV